MEPPKMVMLKVAIYLQFYTKQNYHLITKVKFSDKQNKYLQTKKENLALTDPLNSIGCS